MIRFFAQAQAHPDITAAASATTSIGSATVAFLSQATEVVSLIAGVVAIVSGAFAIWYTIERIYDLRRKRNAQRRQRGKLS